ncbi:hypothetical protein DFH07DRAFT_783127 [Mycena maculata]|uniref:Uncharacterized protein n=1 Tax=Mycena maculata TaxID=230809 RepID=A0AAD7MN37_9AGAR|nr:hypothetical protein DFH07DRAFT_783127 [Mycena maculata]
MLQSDLVVQTSRASRHISFFLALLGRAVRMQFLPAVHFLRRGDPADPQLFYFLSLPHAPRFQPIGPAQTLLRPAYLRPGLVASNAERGHVVGPDVAPPSKRCHVVATLFLSPGSPTPLPSACKPSVVRTKPCGTYSSFLDYSPWASFTPTWDRNGRAIIPPPPACKPQAYWSSPRPSPPPWPLPFLLAGALSWWAAKPVLPSHPRAAVRPRQTSHGCPRTPDPERHPRPTPTLRGHPCRPNPARQTPHTGPRAPGPSGRPHTPNPRVQPRAGIPADPTHTGVPMRQAPSGRPHTPTPSNPHPLLNPTPPCLPAHQTPHFIPAFPPSPPPTLFFFCTLRVLAPHPRAEACCGYCAAVPLRFPQASLRCKPLAGIPARPSPCGCPCAAVPTQASLQCKPREAVPARLSLRSCPCGASLLRTSRAAVPTPQSLCSCPCVGIPAVQTPHGYPYAAVSVRPFRTPVDTRAAVLAPPFAELRVRGIATWRRSCTCKISGVYVLQGAKAPPLSRARATRMPSPARPHHEAFDSRQTHPLQLPWALHQAPGPALRAPNLNRGSSRASPCAHPRLGVPVVQTLQRKPCVGIPAWAFPLASPRTVNPTPPSPCVHPRKPCASLPVLPSLHHHPFGLIMYILSIVLVALQ